jgi:hypothetical protein
VEHYLAKQNIHHRRMLLSWRYLANGSYQFWFAKEKDGGAMQSNSLCISPWQVYSFTPPETTIWIPKGHEFCTLRLASHYDLMVPGDPIEILRMNKVQPIGFAEVISIKRTLVRFLDQRDTTDFLRINKKHEEDGILKVLSDYYETELDVNTAVIVMHLRAATNIGDAIGKGPCDPANTGSLRGVIDSITKKFIRGI